nr:hypothetical protein [Butyrivibrio sp.]
MISITEIVLIVIGIAALVAGYLIPVGREIDEEQKRLIEQEVDESIRYAINNSRNKIDDMVDDSAEESINKMERAMDRLTNEKISAISEYSDTVINDIHKNHDEVVFMYDMLNDKHKNLTSTVSEVTKKADEARQTVLDAQLTAHEAEEAAVRIRELEKNSPSPEETLLANSEEVKISEVRAQQARALENKVQEKLNRLIRPDITANDDSEDKSINEKNKEDISGGKNVTYKENNYNNHIKEDNKFEGNVLLENAPVLTREEVEKENTIRKENIGQSAIERLSNAVNTKLPEQNTQDDEVKDFKALQNLPIVHVIENELADNIKEYLDDEDDNDDNPGGVVRPRSDASNQPQASKVVTISEAKEEVRKKQSVVENDEDMDINPSAQNRQILEMHKAGKSNMVIARELGVGIGEVRLVIDLSNK